MVVLVLDGRTALRRNGYRPPPYAYGLSAVCIEYAIMAGRYAPPVYIHGRNTDGTRTEHGPNTDGTQTEHGS